MCLEAWAKQARLWAATVISPAAPGTYRQQRAIKRVRGGQEYIGGRAAWTGSLAWPTVKQLMIYTGRPKMHVSSVASPLACLTAAVAASPPGSRQGATANGTNVVSALWDGTCFYPRSVSSLDLGSYLGTWYQVAGYEAIFTAGCKCVTATYTLNHDGTVGVTNRCEALGLPISITGSAAPVDGAYGGAGALEVTLSNSTNACPGPNYVVQEYAVDDYAIVQSPDFATLFVLSRAQDVPQAKLDVSINQQETRSCRNMSADKALCPRPSSPALSSLDPRGRSSRSTTSRAAFTPSPVLFTFNLEPVTSAVGPQSLLANHQRHIAARCCGHSLSNF